MENKQEPTFTTGLEKMRIPALGERRKPKYKWKAIFYKRIAIALFVTLTGVAYLLGITIRGNLVLVQKLQDSKIINILPSGERVLK